MSKKILYIITAIVLIPILLIGIWFIYSASRGGTPLSDIKKTLKSVSPFGEADPFGIKKVLDTVKNIGGGTPNAGTATETSIPENTEQLMFKLSNERASGVGFADVLVANTREVLKKISIDDPRVPLGGTPKKILVTATTTETYYATTTRIRYVEQGSGHIYEHDFASSTTRKITNTTIPKTSEAYFLANGTKVLLRYLDASNKKIENYLATIPNSSVTDSLTGTFLPSNITALSVAPGGGEFFYMAKTASGSIGNIFSTKTNTERRVFSSAFSEWLPVWSGDGVFLQTKPSSAYPGYLYTQNIIKNTFSRIAGGDLGMTSLPSPDGKKVLVGVGTDIYLIDVVSGVRTPVPGLYTLPEKCVWRDNFVLLCFGQDIKPSESMPESWYQGLMFFEDSLYSVAADSSGALKIATASELYTKDISIDGILPAVTKDGSALIFINKKDMTPWYINMRPLYNNFTIE